MRIDLHTHSTASDGTDTPAELVAAAAGAGLDVLAITDHDTTSGWAEAAAALPSGMRLGRGAEVSCVSAGGRGGRGSGEPRRRGSPRCPRTRPRAGHIWPWRSSEPA